MPDAAMARDTVSPEASPPRSESSDAEAPRRTRLRSALKTPPPTSSRIVPGLDAAGTYGPDTWPRRSIWAPPTASIFEDFTMRAI